MTPGGVSAAGPLPYTTGILPPPTTTTEQGYTTQEDLTTVISVSHSHTGGTAEEVLLPLHSSLYATYKPPSHSPRGGVPTMSYTTAGLPLQTAIRPPQGLLGSPPAPPPHRPVMSATLSGPPPPGTSPGTSCCQTGRPIMADPVTGQTVCSCQLTPSLSVSYPRLASLPESLYGSAAAYSAQALMASSPFASNGGPDGGLYSPFGAMSPYELKDAAEVYRGLTQTPSGLLAYDPTAMFTYPFGAGYGGMDLSAARRNKNATRETTSTLKAWLYEHRKNPYPTKGEKIMLAIITKMTLTQVSTWFANARRRLKKDNKMTWTPKNGSGAESDNDDDDANNDVTHRDVDDKELDVGSTSDNATHDDHRLDDSRDSIDIDTLSDKDPGEALRGDGNASDDASRLRASTPDRDQHDSSSDHHHHHHHHHHHQQQHPHLHPHHPATTIAATTTADLLRHHQQQHHHSQQSQQARTDHEKSPPGGHSGVGGIHPGLGPRPSPYSHPSRPALQRTQGPYHMPYPPGMAQRMGLPPALTAMTSAAELPGLRPTSHAFSTTTSSSSSSSSSSSTSIPFSSPVSSTRSSSPPPETTIITSPITKDSPSLTTINNNNVVKPKIWSLADIVTSSSSSGNHNSHVTSASVSPPVKTTPLRPSPGGGPAGLPPSALGSLRAWSEATGGHYGLAAAMAAAQGVLPHPFSRGPPTHGVAGLAGMAAGFPGMPGGIPMMATQHQNGFFAARPAERLSVDDRFRADSPTSSDDNKTAFKPVPKSKPAEVNV